MSVADSATTTAVRGDRLREGLLPSIGTSKRAWATSQKYGLAHWQLLIRKSTLGRVYSSSAIAAKPISASKVSDVLLRRASILMP